MAEIIRLEVGNIDAFKKAMVAAGDNIEEQAKVLARFKRDTGKGIPVELEYSVKNRGKAAIRDIRTGIKGLTEEERKFRDQLAKGTSVEKKSILATRQRLAQAKQVLSSLNQNTEAYARQERRVERLNAVLQRRQGIQLGSVSALQTERNALLEYGKNTALTARARDQFNKQLLASNESLRRAQGIEKGSIDDLKARRSELQALSGQYAIGSRRQQQYANEIALINRQLAQTVPTFQRFITSLNQIATIQAGFTAISAFAGQVNGLINQFTGRIKQIENFRLAIQNVGFSISETSEFFEQATATAFKLGAPVTQVEQAYRRMIPALESAGINSSDSTKFIEALAARTQTLGLSSEQSGRLVEAFAQVLSKGKLQAEELNQQISEVDGAFRGQFAESLGITIEQLSEFTKEGKVLSSEFVKGVIGMQNGVDALAGKVANGNLTIQQLQNTISNINTKSLELIGTAVEPAIRAILRITLAIQKFAAEIAKSRFGQLIAQAFNESLAGIEAFVQSLFTVIGIVGEFLRPLANLLLLLQQNVFGLGSITKALVYLAGVLVTVRLGVAALTKSLTLAAALAGGRFVSSWGAAGAALLSFASVAKSILTLNFAGFGLKVQRSLGLVTQSFVLASSGGKSFQNTISNLIRALSGSKGSFSQFAKRFDQLNNGLGRTAKGAKITSSSWRELGSSANTAGAATNGLVEGLVSSGVELGINALQGKKAGKVTGDLAKGASRAAGSSKGFAGVMRGLGSVLLNAGKASQLFLKFLKSTVLFAAVAAALEILVSSVLSYVDASNSLGKATDELNSKLKQQGIIAKENTTFWQRLGKALKLIFLDLGGLVPLFQGIAVNRAATVEIDKLTRSLAEVKRFLKESNMLYTENGSKLQFNAESTAKASAAILASKDAIDQQLAALDLQIKKLQENENANETQINQLKEKRAQLVAMQAEWGRMANRLDVTTGKVEDYVRQDSDLEQQIYDTNRALSERSKRLEEITTEAASNSQKEYVLGLITEGEQLRRNAAVEAYASNQRLADLQEAIQLAAKRQTQITSEVEKYKNELEIKRLINESQKEQNVLQEKLIALRDANIKALDEEIAKVTELQGIYSTVESTSSGIAGTLGSTISSAISSIQEGIKKAAAFEFSVTLDSSSLARAANVRQKLGALEFRLEKVKIETERIIQVSTLRRVAAEQRLLAAQLRAKGDDKGAQLAEDAANAIEKQIPALNNAYNLQSQIVGLQERGYKAEVNRKRELLGLPTLFENTVAPSVQEWENLSDSVYNTADAYEYSSGVAQAAAQNGADAFVQAAATIQENSERRFQQQQEITDRLLAITEENVKSLQELLAKIGETEIQPKVSVDTEQAKTEVQEYKTILDSFIEAIRQEIDGKPVEFKVDAETAKKETEEYQTYLQKIFGQIKKDIEATVGDFETGTTARDEFTKPGPWESITGKIRELASAVDDLFKPRQAPRFDPFGDSNPVRWMGGPVTSGQTYTVNDGGGREGFVDKFNNFKMLPAGRNIQWTPTTSGTVIPAHLVDQFKQSITASKVNTATSTRINPSVNNVNASLDSGNLVKQIGSVMAGAGGNQRITNNVTIQSQAPVMDASRLMANVSRLRNRRRNVL